jgi:hypothetical protein
MFTLSSPCCCFFVFYFKIWFLNEAQTSKLMRGNQLPVSATGWQHGSLICFAIFMKNHKIAKNSTSKVNISKVNISKTNISKVNISKTNISKVNISKVNKARKKLNTDIRIF